LSNGIYALLATRRGSIDFWPKLTARREWLLQGDESCGPELGFGRVEDGNREPESRKIEVRLR
jgi:hypothetical protein